MNRKLLLTLGFIGAVKLAAFAQEPVSTEAGTTQANVLDMSIEDLLNIKVESSTKSAISLQEAPSVVRIFTQKDFQTRGFYTLKDVLNTVPGLQVQEYIAGHQLVWTRGVQSRYNNKVLLLIDGVPMRDAFYGNFNVDEMIPLESIEKVEILNGPGSVLYGANSFAGVINITTKKHGNSVGANYGTYNTKAAYAEGAIKGLYAFGKVYQTDGFAPDLYMDGKYRDRTQEGKNTNLLLKYNYKDFTAIASYTNYSYPYRFRQYDREDHFTRSPIYGALKYKKDFGSLGSINATAYYNDFRFEREKTRFTVNKTTGLVETNKLRSYAVEYLNTAIMGTDIDYTLVKGKHNITSGVSWLHDLSNDIREESTAISAGAKTGNITTNNTLTSNPNRNTIGLFAQDLFRVNEHLNITGGVRYDILSDFDNQFNYRGGITSKITQNLYAKALFGTAYRVPMYREYLEAAAPNSGISPEKLQTAELQIGYVTSQFDINLTFFNNSYSNFIKEIDVDSMTVDNQRVAIDDEVSFNFDKRTINGLELNIVASPVKALNIYAGGSYLITAEEQLGAIRADVLPSVAQNTTGTTSLHALGDWNGYFNINYILFDKLTLASNSYFVGNRSVTTDYQTTVPTLSKDNVGSFVKQDFFIQYNVWKGLRVNMKVDNAFNATILSPSYGNMSSYATQWQGRVFRFGVSYIFN
jgi:outer membrane cobalamin receptor